MVKLVRLTEIAESTFGVLLVMGMPMFSTMELSYNNNLPNISCIPPGKYLAFKTLDRTTSGGMKIPVTYEVRGVLNRSGILFHVGNTRRDTQGCVLLGTSYGWIDGAPAVKSSREAFARFLTKLRTHNDFTFEVVNAWS